LTLSFENLERVAEVNKRNRDSWLPLFPTYDPEFWKGAEDKAFSIVGRNDDGEIVATQALRVFEWPETSFGAEAESLRLLYRDPKVHALAGESCVVTAKKAWRLSGRVTFSGGIWFRPDFRGRKLTGIMVRLGRAYAIAHHDITHNTAMMSETVFNKGLYKEVGYSNFDEWVEMRGSRLGTFRLKLMWMDVPELLDDFANFLETLDSEGLPPKRDPRIGQRYAQ
jgi:hypothetical protein